MEIRIGKVGNLKNIANCKYSLKRGIVFLEEFQPEIISAHSTLIGCSIAPNIKGNAMKPLQVLFLFPEAFLPLRVIQPRLVEAIDKAVNHVDAPCMIGVVGATSPCSDAFLHLYL
jgi:hypothetical protein